jgi:zinc ribbon protein
MNFETELMYLKERIDKAESIDDLDYLRRVNEKKYWWSSILVTGLFYGLNGKVGKMIIGWIVGPITLGIYSLYLMYTSYKDQKEFNDQMEFYILNRRKELEKTNSSTTDASIVSEDDINSNFCTSCGNKVKTGVKFCENCGTELLIN